jgi:hypothetical protein
MWISLADVAEPQGRMRRHRAIAESVGPGAPARLPLAWEVEAIAWFIGEAIGNCLIQGSALPSPDPARAWVRIGGSGLAEELAFSPIATPRQPSMGTARRAITRLLEPVVNSAGERAGRVLWWHAGDRVADALLWCGAALGAESDVRRIAEHLLAPGVPYAVSLAIVGDGLRVRRTCCLSRRTAAGETCDTCPHAHAGQRARSLGGPERRVTHTKPG